MTIDVYSKTSDSINVTLKGTNASIHAWNEYYYFGYTYKYQSAFSNMNKTWATTGNVMSTVSDMGAGDSVLLVGAYASKINFQDINGSNWTYSSYVQAGNLVPFSSRGPMIDGRIKPDITAPGLTIATSVSSFDTSYTAIGSNRSSTRVSYLDPALNKKFYYSEFSGTSASAPASTGIVALLLQARPTMGLPKQINDVITQTAIKDGNTGILPAAGNNNWGHGKINAYGAMKSVISMTNAGIYSYAGEKLDCELFPNPNNGLFTLRFDSAKNQDLNFEIYNMVGDLIQSENWKTVNGSNLHPVDLAGMPGGVYLLKVSSSDGFVSIKTIKQ